MPGTGYHWHRICYVFTMYLIDMWPERNFRQGEVQMELRLFSFSKWRHSFYMLNWIGLDWEVFTLILFVFCRFTVPNTWDVLGLSEETNMCTFSILPKHWNVTDCWHLFSRKTRIFPFTSCLLIHYNAVIMSAMASQITGVPIVYLTVCSGTDKKNTETTRYWPLCGEFTGDRWIARTKGQ